MRSGEPFPAQGEYLQYLAVRPGDPDAYAGLARAMALAGDREGARRNYRTACELLMDAMRRGESETVYQEAVRGIDDFTLAVDYQLGMAFGLERDLKPTLALQAYEMFAAKYSGHAESPFALLRAAGIHLNVLSNARAADGLYKRLLADYPDDTWAEFAKEQRRRLGCQSG
jgi:tetratricopeptide (TPR) repeat protein